MLDPVRPAHTPRVAASPDTPIVLQAAYEGPAEPEPEVNLASAYYVDVSRHALLTAEQEVELAKTIEVGVYVQHLLDTGRSPTAELAALVEQGERARSRMIEANLRLVLSIARGFRRHPRYTLLDRVQDGNLGLIRAVQKFDFAQGTKFSTYATWWIKQAIDRARCDNADIIRKPVHMHERRKNEPEIEPLFSEPVPADEIDDDVADAHRAEVLHRRLREPGDEALLDRDEADRLLGRLGRSDPRGRIVLEMRNGFTTGEPMTLEEIGLRFGLTRERIRQLEKRALSCLRELATTAPGHAAA